MTLTQFNSVLFIALFLAAIAAGQPKAAATESDWQAVERPGQIALTHRGKPVLTYVYADEKTLRPYLAHAHAPNGRQLTRHHPPREGGDATDHATMHPGIWLGFGDLGGGDFWRNKGRVELAEFIDKPAATDEGVKWKVRNRYVNGDRTVCHETAEHTARLVDGGYLLTFDSSFTGDEAFAFGDQEEMGLGVRTATGLQVKDGSGVISNSGGGRNEAGVWGRQAKWCDYSAVLDGRRTGMLLVPHPENFRASWFHARDYGFVAANPFGRKAFTGGEPSRIEVKPGESLRLRFAVWLYALDKDQPFDAEAIVRRYVQESPGREAGAK